MPVELGIWNFGGDGSIQPVEYSSMESEEKLERALVTRLDVLDPSLMLLGSQVTTDYGKIIDLLAIDAEGDLHVIELKRDRTPRQVVAQLLDYATWVQNLTYADVKYIYEQKYDQIFESAFDEQFGDGPPDEVNDNHRLTVVAAELDNSTERIIDYLSENYGVPINAVFFRYFLHGDDEFLIRSWLIDPHRAEERTQKKTSQKKESWNGRDYYVSFGEERSRNWDDARRYGFVSAGQGRWYSRTLQSLSPGDRIFVNIPKTGYVGVAEVTDEVVPITEFTVHVDGQTINILDAPLSAPAMDADVGDEDKQEYLVRVDWLATRKRENAVWEKGMFANQNTVCRLRNQFTIDTLTKRFGLQD